MQTAERIMPTRPRAFDPFLKAKLPRIIPVMPKINGKKSTAIIAQTIDIMPWIIPGYLLGFSTGTPTCTYFGC